MNICEHLGTSAKIYENLRESTKIRLSIPMDVYGCLWMSTDIRRMSKIENPIIPSPSDLDSKFLHPRFSVWGFAAYCSGGPHPTPTAYAVPTDFSLDLHWIFLGCSLTSCDVL